MGKGQGPRCGKRLPNGGSGCRQAPKKRGSLPFFAAEGFAKDQGL